MKNQEGNRNRRENNENAGRKYEIEQKQMEKKDGAAVKYHHSPNFHCYDPKWDSWAKSKCCMLTGHKKLVPCLQKHYYSVNWNLYSYHIISAEIFQSRFHDHSPFRCNWSAVQWWCGLRTLVHHTFLGGCWETRVCCQSLACIQSVCSSLEKQINQKLQDPTGSKKKAKRVI